MNKTRFSVLIVAIFMLAILVGEIKAQEISVESIHIVRIIEQDEKATIKLPDGRMHILKVGDDLTKEPLRVTGSGLRVVEITEGRIVIEEKTDKGPGKIIIRVENGKQRVERIRKTGDSQPVLYAPK